MIITYVSVSSLTPVTHMGPPDRFLGTIRRGTAERVWKEYLTGGRAAPGQKWWKNKNIQTVHRRA